MPGRPKAKAGEAKASSGIQEDGRWLPAFPGQRPPLATTHGAWSKFRIEPKAAELADEIRVHVPACTDADEYAIRLLALSLAQVEAATLWLAEQGLVQANGQPQGILRHLGTMVNTAARLCAQLGMTPTSRAQLGLDLTRARGEALREHIEETYERGEESAS